MKALFVPCTIAMLAAITTTERITIDELRRQVPWTEPAMATPDVSAWFDRLQDLLDLRFIARVPVDDGYVYRATLQGLAVVVALSARSSRKGLAAA